MIIPSSHQVFKPDKMNGFDVQSEADAMLERQNRDITPRLLGHKNNRSNSSSFSSSSYFSPSFYFSSSSFSSSPSSSFFLSLLYSHKSYLTSHNSPSPIHSPITTSLHHHLISSLLPHNHYLQTTTTFHHLHHHCHITTASAHHHHHTTTTASVHRHRTSTVRTQAPS